MTKLTHLERLTKAKVAIMRHPDFCPFSGLLSAGKLTVDTTPTACTDGFNIRFGAKFIDTLNDKELRFVLLHEGMHIAYRHLRVWRDLWKQDRKLTNIAADYFVNGALVDMDPEAKFIEMPKVGIQPRPEFRGLSVLRIFRILQQEQEQQEDNPRPDDQGDPTNGDPTNGDPTNGDPTNGDPSDDGQGQDSHGGFDDHDWDGADELSEAEAAKQAEEIDRALRQGEATARKLRAGKGGGRSSLTIEDLLTPKVDWREVLRQFVQESCQGRDDSTWARPHRRYLADDVYLPSYESITIEELVVVLDTSGSCFEGSVITAFASEFAGIIDMVRPGKVHVLYVDAYVSGHQTFVDGQFAVGNMTPTGGGGTDMTAAFRYMAKEGIKPAATIFLTDGVTPFGTATDCDSPVLWCITEPGITAPWGTTIHVEV